MVRFSLLVIAVTFDQVCLCLLRDERSVSASLQGNKTDTQALNYAVESRVYPDLPHLAFVTCRGGGLTVLSTSLSGDGSSNAESPSL